MWEEFLKWKTICERKLENGDMKWYIDKISGLV